MSCQLMDRKRLLIATAHDDDDDDDDEITLNKRRKTSESEKILVQVPCTAPAIVSHVPSARVSESGTLSSSTESSLSSVERPLLESFSKMDDDEEEEDNNIGQDSSHLPHGPSGALDSSKNPSPESTESYAEQTDNSARCHESSSEIRVDSADTHHHHSNNGTLDKHDVSETTTTSSSCPNTTTTTTTTISRKPLQQDKTEKCFSNKAIPDQHPTLLQLAPLPNKTLLLALPSDASVLNPLHVFVRKQIEVFQASLADIAQPAPGRKNAVSLGQVGLRCIHCRHLPQRDRVKRAICYPSSVGRVYHSVSDMKFDHFSNCKGLPPHLRTVFNALKDDCKKKTKTTTTERKKKCAGTCSSSTAQYYHDSAMSMGMVDKSTGVFMKTKSDHLTGSDSGKDAKDTTALDHTPSKASANLPQDASTAAPSALVAGSALDHADEGSITVPRSMIPALILGQHQIQQNPYSLLPFAPMLYSMLLPSMNLTPRSPSEFGVGKDDSSKCIPMSSMDDHKHLNPLHCFVRRQVEIFTATKKDIAAPSPGRKARIVLGQVGIRCMHCAKQPIKDRVKRAVCFPPSINGIYHSVSNMKFDHFGKCTSLPKQAQAEFAALRSECSGRNPKGKDAKSSSSSSTAQYYHASAIRAGLIDTPDGIRFKSSSSTGTAVSAVAAKKQVIHTAEIKSSPASSSSSAATPTLPSPAVAKTSARAVTTKSSLATVLVAKEKGSFVGVQQQQQQELEQAPAEGKDAEETKTGGAARGVGASSSSPKVTDGMSALMIAATEHGVRAAFDKNKMAQSVWTKISNNN